MVYKHNRDPVNILVLVTDVDDLALNDIQHFDNIPLISKDT